MDEFNNDNQNNNQDFQDNKTDSNTDFAIPEEYQNKGWSRFFDGKTGDDLKNELFRSYDNSQTLIGKKVEDYLANVDLKNLDNYEQIKDSLIKQIMPEYNTPEDIKDYNLTDVISKAEKILPIDESAINSIAGKFKELGVSSKQGQEIFKEYLNLTIQDFKKITNPEELEQNISKMFNGNTEQRKQVESLISEFLPEEDKKIIQKIVPNNIVEMFYKVAKGFVEKYDYKESTTNSSKSNQFKMSEADKNQEYDRLYKKLIELDNRPQKVGEREAILKQMQNLFR